MQLRMGLLNRPEGWSAERFRAHWRDHHGPLAARLPGLQSYVQNHVTDSVQRGIAFRRGPEQLDGISQLAFGDAQAMTAALASEVGPALAADEQAFIGRLRILTLEPHVVKPPPPPGTALKRMSLLRRRPDVSPERFAREWRDVHGPLAGNMPGVLGYRQNLVTGRQSPKGVDVPYEALPIDGVVELWFADPATLDAAFASPQGQRTMAHAASFILEITSFLVEPVTIA